MSVIVNGIGPTSGASALGEFERGRDGARVRREVRVELRRRPREDGRLARLERAVSYVGGSATLFVVDGNGFIMTAAHVAKRQGNTVSARAANGRLAQLIGMGKAGHLARNPAQAKPGIARIVGGFQAAIVETEGLAGHELHVQLAIIAGFQSIARNALRSIRIKQAGLVKIGAWVCISHGAYMGRCGSG